METQRIGERNILIRFCVLEMAIGLKRSIILFKIFTLVLCQSVQTSELADTWKGVYFGKALDVDAAFDTLHVYTTIPNVSFPACKEECKKRYECGFINYWTQVKLCYILRTVDPFVQGYEGYIRSLPGHLLGVKLEWVESEVRFLILALSHM